MTGTLRSLLQRRLLQQRLASDGAGATSAAGGPAATVAWLGAIQAQDYLGALWAVGVRTPGATEGDVERAVAERSIVRSWPLRGTLHLVAAADVRWMLELLAPRNIARQRRRAEQLGLDGAAFRQSERRIVRALEGGRQLSRDAIFRLLADAGVSPAGQRGIHVLWRLAQERVVCFGARQGKQHTFVLLDDWLRAVPAAIPLPREQALAELAMRYFRGHGPATAQDFAWWSGLAAAEARTAIEAAAPLLARATFDGEALWMPAEAPAAGAKAPAAHLLPPFDELLLGYRDRSAMLAPEHARRIVPGGNGMFLPLLVLGGRVAGTWKRELRRRAVAVVPQPFGPLGPAEQRAVRRAASAYARFLGLTLLAE